MLPRLYRNEDWVGCKKFVNGHGAKKRSLDRMRWRSEPRKTMDFIVGIRVQSA